MTAGTQFDVLLVDGGQTGTRLLALRDGRRVSDVLEETGLAPLAPAGGPDRVAGDLTDACRRRGLTAMRGATLVAGLTGLGEVWERCAELSAALHAQLGADEVVLASDVVTSHLGALSGGPGVVAAIGTGAVVLAIGSDGTHARVDGWGHLLGDAGSGFAIGLAGLRAALAAHDGRGEGEALREAAVARFGPIERIAGLLLADPARVRTIASFAPDVAAAARAGDATSVGIWASAAEDVAASVRAAISRLPSDEEQVTVSWAGSLLDVDDLLRTPVRRLVAEDAPHARWQAPAGGALDGAAALSEPSVRRRLAGLVHHSSR